MQNNAQIIDFQKLASFMEKEQILKRFVIKVGMHLKIIYLHEVAYFYRDAKITFAVTWDKKRYPMDQSLEKLEELLDEGEFFRINRQCIVHIRSIGKMWLHSKSRVKLELQPATDIETIVSSDRSPQFKRWLVGE